MNTPQMWYTAYGLNLIVTAITGNIITGLLMLVCIVGLAYSENVS
jgi:hypothetical protein